MPLTKYQRERIVSLHLQNKGSASNILKIIAIERIYTTNCFEYSIILLLSTYFRIINSDDTYT